VQLPTDGSPGSLFVFVLQLMGLTWTNIREILVRHIGPKNIELIEKAWQLISLLIEKGTAGIVELLKEKLGTGDSDLATRVRAIEYKPSAFTAAPSSRGPTTRSRSWCTASSRRPGRWTRSGRGSAATRSEP
jgi:hypothetical protein